MYEGVKSEVFSINRFDENSDMSMTYLGRIDMTRTSKIKAEQKFLILGQGYVVEKLLYGTEMSDTLRYRSKQIVHVQVVLFKM